MIVNNITQAEQAPPAAAPPPRVKLLFLDGLRGLAALYVLLFHIYDPSGLSPLVRHGLSWLRFGHYAVGVFIVLSGYSLMLPVTRSQDGRIPGGTLDFFKRRARRILPPYYAATALSIAIGLVANHWTSSKSVAGGIGDDGLSYGSITSHLLLVENWFPRWNVSINVTHWSVATEAQIYLLFPFLLLPLYRRFGVLTTVLAGMVIGILPLLLLPPSDVLIRACPQFLGLFALGMAGAAINFSEKSYCVRLRNTLPWGVIAALSFCLFVVIIKLWTRGLGKYGQLEMNYPWMMDILIGLATGCLIIFCAKRLTSQSSLREPLVLRLLESRFATFLGVFSYSIYLMHLPILFKMKNVFNRLHRSDTETMVLMFVVGVPITLLLYYCVTCFTLRLSEGL